MEEAGFGGGGRGDKAGSSTNPPPALSINGLKPPIGFRVQGVQDCLEVITLWTVCVARARVARLQGHGPHACTPLPQLQPLHLPKNLASSTALDPKDPPKKNLPPPQA